MPLILNDDQALLLRSALGYLMAITAAYRQETGREPNPTTDGVLRLALVQTDGLAEAVWLAILSGQRFDMPPAANPTGN